MSWRWQRMQMQAATVIAKCLAALPGTLLAITSSTTSWQTHSVRVNTVVATYRALGVGTSQPEDAEVKRVLKLQRRVDSLHLTTAMRSSVIRNLANNVPY